MSQDHVHFYQMVSAKDGTGIEVKLIFSSIFVYPKSRNYFKKLFWKDK